MLEIRRDRRDRDHCFGGPYILWRRQKANETKCKIYNMLEGKKHQEEKFNRIGEEEISGECEHLRLGGQGRVPGEGSVSPSFVSDCL